MAANPYLLAGFGDGFKSGLELTWRMQDREWQQKARETELEHSKVQADREAEKFQHWRDTAETPEEAKAARGLELKKAEASILASKSQIASNNADARAKNFETDNKIKEQGAKRAKVFGENSKRFGKKIREVANDEQWLTDSEDMDALLNMGMLANEGAVDNAKPTALRFINKTFGDFLNSNTGASLDDYVLNEQNLPKGTRVKRVEAVDIHPTEGGMAVELKVFPEDAKGNPLPTYLAPLTHFRESGPKAQVKVIPYEMFQQASKGAALIASDIRQAREAMGLKPGEKMDVEELDTYIDAALSETRKQVNPKDTAKVTKDGFIVLDPSTNTWTPVKTQPGISPAQQYRAYLDEWDRQLKETGDPSMVTPDTVFAVLMSAKQYAEGGGGGVSNGLPSPKTKEEYNSIPSGQKYIHPDGQTKVKP